MIFRLSAWMAIFLLWFRAGGRLKKTIGVLAALAVRIAGIAALLSVGTKIDSVDFPFDHHLASSFPIGITNVTVDTINDRTLTQRRA